MALDQSGANLKSKGQRSTSIIDERKCKDSFSRLSPLKVDQFTSNEDQNDHQPILHISLNAFHQRKCLVL